MGEDAHLDDELIRRAKSGDDVAVSRVLWAYYEPLRTYIDRQLSPRNRARVSAEDVLQDVMQEVFRDFRTVAPTSEVELRNWLWTVAKHRMLNAIRGANAIKRGGNLTQRSIGQDGSITDVSCEHDSSAAPGKSLEREEAVVALRATVGLLPSDQRDAVDRYYLRGESLEQAALGMNRTQAAVRGLLHRAKKALRAAMGRSSKWFYKK